ncbi:MAG: hypothetical protein FJ295_16070 [Planctomycetes bacterium]|nr:hypothetical protein [Planctomycetota bacterium]
MKRRRAFQWMLFVAAILVVVRLSFFRGLFSTLRVSGGSMAEAYPGEHFSLACRDCRFRFRVDASTARRGRIVCPNCGFVNCLDDGAILRQGQRVMVDHWPVTRGAIQRGDVLAAVVAEEGSAAVIKRVVGLPGERIAIRDGELYVNDELWRKNYQQFCELAVLVYDDLHRPSLEQSPPPRWKPDAGSEPWRLTAKGLRWQREIGNSESTHPDRLDWIEYQHWNCVDGPHPRFETGPILDNDPYNSASSHHLRPVHDLAVSLELITADGALLAMRLPWGADWIEVRLRVDDVGGEVFLQERLIEKFKTSAFRSDAWVNVDFTLCDRQIWLHIDGEQLVHSEIPKELANNTPAPRGSIQFGACPYRRSSLDPAWMRLERIRIWRDIYYRGTGVDDPSWNSAVPLADDEYFLLGDNPILSRDSRHWPARTVLGSQLRGKVWKRAEETTKE